MSSKLTSNQLIESIKRRASIPSSQSTFSADDFLKFADEELSLSLVPEIMVLHEDYLLYEELISLVPGQTEYTIPSRAISSKLRDVQYVNTNSNTTSEMTRVGIGDRFNDFNSTIGTYLRQFYVKNNKIVLLGDSGISSGDALRMVYYISPSNLVEDEFVAVVKNIAAPSGGTVVLTLQNFPEDFRASNDLGVPQKYDFYHTDSPNTIIKKDVTIVGLNLTAKTITIAEDDLPSDLQIGDHMSFAGECSIPQVPSELHPMLAQMVACRVLESQTDTQGLQNALLTLSKMQKAAGILIDNRVEDAPRKIKNRHSLLRSSTFSRWFNSNR